MNERREEAVGVTIILHLDKKRGNISDFGQISKIYNSVFGKHQRIKLIKLVSAVISLHDEFPACV